MFALALHIFLGKERKNIPNELKCTKWIKIFQMDKNIPNG
jgi:hypothetical protein